MSGSTVIRQRKKRYEIRLETPSISFAPDPERDPSQPTHEQEYHASAAKRFKEALAPLDGPFDDALDEIVRDLRIQLVALDQGTKWNMHVGSPPVDVGFDHANVTLAFAKLPDEPTQARVREAIGAAVAKILIAHYRLVTNERRRGPVPDKPARFHYTRVSDGSIEDLNGEPDGAQPANLEGDAAIELCASLAAIIAIADEDGVVHANLDISNIRIDGDAVSIGGFGETIYSRAAHPPEGNSDLFVHGPRIDWTARQRYSLGYVCYQALTGKELEDPPLAIDERAREMVARLLARTPERRPTALDAWGAFAKNIPSHAAPTRRSTSKVPARLAAGTRGILVPCWVCGQPALRNAGRNKGTRESYGPYCCWYVRERRMTRAIGVALVITVGAALAYLLH